MLIAFGVVLFCLLTSYRVVLNVIGYIYDVLFPVLLGALFAFILNVPMSAIERHLFKPPKNPKRQKLVENIKRPCSIVLTLLIAIGVVVLLLALIIPALAETVSTLSKSIPSIVDHISDTIENNRALSSLLSKFDITRDSVVNGLTDWLKGGVKVLQSMDSTMSVASAIFSSLVNFLLATFFAIYFLAQKETLKRNAKKLCKAFLPNKANGILTRIAARSVDTFGRFLSGQCMDAVLLGSLTALGMSLLGFPYALLIGVVISVTALIPILGSCIGMLIGFMLICASSFNQAVWFLVFLLCLVQIDCNFIYPRIVGNSVGLPSLWVLFAVTVGGRLFGVLGMFLAVPICAVVYSALSEIIKDRLAKKDKLKKFHEAHGKKRKDEAEAETADAGPTETNTSAETVETAETAKADETVETVEMSQTEDDSPEEEPPDAAVTDQ